ncbi:hypothetical protein D3C81_2151140 [compost metagenome]
MNPDSIMAKVQMYPILFLGGLQAELPKLVSSDMLGVLLLHTLINIGDLVGMHPVVEQQIRKIS